MASLTPADVAGAATPSSAVTVDYNCHKHGDHIYTCQWLRQSLIYVPTLGRDNYQFRTWASMKGGTVKREIIQIWLEYQEVPGGAIFHSPSGIPVKEGSGSISGFLGYRLCSAIKYRPVFQYKYLDASSHLWIKGWSYGGWYSTDSLGNRCDANPGVDH